MAKWKNIRIPGELHDEIFKLAKSRGIALHAALTEYFSGPYLESLQKQQLEACHSCYEQTHKEGFDEGYLKGREHQESNCTTCRKAIQNLAYNAGIRRGTEITLEDYQYPCCKCGELIMPSKEDLLKAFANWGHEGCLQ